MTLLPTNVRKRSVRHRGANVAVAILAAAAVLLGAGVGLGSTSPASAAVFGITTADNSFFSSSVTLTGTKDLQSTVRIPSITGGDAYCIEPPAGAPQRENWSCTFSLPDGSHEIRVLEYSNTDPETVLEASVTVRVLGSPVISGPQLTKGRLTGTGYPGAAIRLTGASGACQPVEANGFWQCVLDSPSGNYSVAAIQSWPGNTAESGPASAPAAITVDKDAPALPVFSQPTAGSRVTAQPTTFAGGNGEATARVDVYVDGSLVCSGTVTSGSWSCTASLPDGERRVQAIQWDAAENPSGSTTPFAVTVGAVTATPPPAPAAPGAPPAPTAPNAPSAEQPPAAPAEPPASDPQAAPAPDYGQGIVPGLPFFPPPVGGYSGLPPLETWDIPTYYGAAIPSVSSASSPARWTLALALAGGFLVLVAFPLRLLLAALRTRGLRRPERTDGEPLLAPPVTAVLALGAAVLLAAIAGGIQGEARYLRLMIGIGLALTTLNAASVLTAKLAGRAVPGGVAIRLAPLFLAIAAVTAIASRTGGIQPPVIVGVVLAAAFAVETTTRQRGIVSLLQLVVMAALGLGAWLGHSALGPVEGFGLSLASETLAALCLAALGSVVMLLLPVSQFPGRLIFDWSPLAWIGVALPTVTVAAVVIAGAQSFPIGWVVGASLTFAAVATAVWAWIDLVEPTLATSRRQLP